MSSVTFVKPDSDYFIVRGCPPPRPGDVIEHTDEDPGTDGLWVVVDRPFQWRTYGWSKNMLSTVFVHVERTDRLP